MSQFNINSTCAEYTTMTTITGQVFDAVTDETLPFANVYLSIDTTIGTAANEDGVFTIDVPKGSTLTASFVGYHLSEFVAQERFTKVFLKPDDQLGTVYLESKKKKSNWLWWLFFGGLAVGVIANSETKETPALGQPMKVKI